MADIVFPGSNAGNPLNSGALPSNNDLVMYKGDYFEMFITLKDSNGDPLVLTGQTPLAYLKSDYDDYMPKQFTCAVTGVPGQVRIFMSSAVTSTLIPGSYIYDFQITNTLGETRTYMAGDVTVYNEVTDG